jgi:protein SCO1
MRWAIVAAVLFAAAGCAELTPGDPRVALFERPWRWTDERGGDVRFAQWRGSPLIVTLFFTSCTTRCPLTIAKLHALDAALRRKGMTAQFALVTLDPQNDDPARLLRFKESRHLPESWHLLRGGPDETREIGRALGVRALRDDGHIDHDVRIAIFDQGGRLVRAFSGWDFDEDQATAAR